MEPRKKIGKYLRYLDKEGWSELIDSRWKGEVKSMLKEKFPDMTEDEWDDMSYIFV
ncbi:MAG: hypothetical protein IJ693_00900 [Bacteroidaceae bacterium]|nr:hypothetical protein [Bacteroidaceae bacterium]